VFQIQHQNTTHCASWDEFEGKLCDHDYATFYDTHEEAQIEIDNIANSFVFPDELSIIEIEQRI